MKIFQHFGSDLVLLLTILVSYRKFTNKTAIINPYLIKLSIADDELALNGYSNVILEKLCYHNSRAYDALKAKQSGDGFWSKIVGTFSALPDNTLQNGAGSSECDMMMFHLLLIFYEY